MRHIPNLDQLEALLPMDQSIKALLFDMDGTLVDTEPMHTSAAGMFFEKNGYKLTENISSLGLTDSDLYDKIEGKLKGGPTISKSSFIKDKNLLLIDMLDNYPLSMPVQLFEFIQEAASNGLKIAVVSASEQNVVEAVLKKIKLLDYVNIISTTSDVWLSKPSPAPYFYALRQLKIHTYNAAIFEDSDTGIASALASGVELINKVSWFSNDK